MSKRRTSYVEVEMTVRLIDGDGEAAATVSSRERQAVPVWSEGNTERHASPAFFRAVDALRERMMVAAIAAMPEEDSR